MAALNDTMRCMDDFIINPTVDVDDQSVLHTADSSQHKYFTKAHWYRQPAPSKPTPLVMKTSPEPTSWHAYTSDEEAASPVHNDCSMVRSRSTSISSESSLPELLADTYTGVEQQCSRAQAIIIKPAGKARMISMPRPIDTSRRSISRPSSAESRKQSLIHHRNPSDSESSTRSSHDSRSASSRRNSVSDIPGSPTSTAPSSIYSEEQERSPKFQPKHQRRTSKHIDLMEAARAIPAPTYPYQPLTPVFKRPANFVNELEEPFTSFNKTSPPTTRVKPKFSSGLKGLGRSFSRKDPRSLTISTQLHEDEEPEQTHTLDHKASPTFSTPILIPFRPRMIARPANERAPAAQLPPFVER